MSIVLYVGGSKDGDKGVVPYGFSKSRTMTEAGPEVYVERMVPLKDGQDPRHGAGIAARKHSGRARRHPLRTPRQLSASA